MRILHTSDWHLGKSFFGYSRAAEHRAFCDEVVALAADVDLVVISGDVFDTYNPPIEAEEQLYDVLARLGDGGRRAVVVIAGNHDSPDRLAAPGPLSASHGVFLLGRPGDVAATTGDRRGGVGVVSAGPSTLVLDLPSGERACVVAVPYPSEARLRALLSRSLDERQLKQAYETRLADWFAERAAACFEPGAVNLLTSHLAVSSCLPSESERALVGGAYQIAGSVFPASAQYVALGHLHRPQAVADAVPVTRYAGAPLAFRVSERDVPRAHTVVTVHPGGAPSVELLPVAAGRPLIALRVSGGLPELVARVEAGELADAFVDLELEVPAPLTHTELATLHKLPVDFLRVRTVLPDGPRETAGNGAPSAVELFRAFVREQTEAEPDPELVALFLELAEGAATGESPAEPTGSAEAIA